MRFYFKKLASTEMTLDHFEPCAIKCLSVSYTPFPKNLFFKVVRKARHLVVQCLATGYECVKRRLTIAFLFSWLRVVDLPQRLAGVRRKPRIF
jgi:hypothetical protein